MLHRGRQLLVRQRTMLSNAIRGHMAELGIISAKGRNGTVELLEIITEPLRSIFMPGTDHVKKVGGSRESLAWARSSPLRWLPRSAIGKHFRPDAT